MKALEDLVARMDDAPLEFYLQAVDILTQVVDDYEAWVEAGRPSYWEAYKACQNAKLTKSEPFRDV